MLAQGGAVGRTPVVYVIPFFAETSLRFLAAGTRLGEVAVGLVSQDPLERLPADIRGRLVAHRRIPHGLDAGSIAAAVTDMGITEIQSVGCEIGQAGCGAVFDGAC